MTMFYAAKVKKTPTISVAYKTDQYFREQNEKTGIDDGHSFGIGHILVLLTLAVTVVWVVWGVMKKGYYMPEIATQFFIMGIVAGVIGVMFHLNDMKMNDIATSFKNGAKRFDRSGSGCSHGAGNHAGTRWFRSDNSNRDQYDHVWNLQSTGRTFRCGSSCADVSVSVRI